jgi:hypothetical protein
MEPAAYKYHFEDIIPNPHWRRAGSWQENNLLFSATWAIKNKTPDPLRFNVTSDRASSYSDEATVKAKAWAEKNLKKPYYLETESGYAVGNSPLTPLIISYEFTLYATKPENDDDEPKGYVSVTYHVDKRTFTGIKQVKD